jgi:Holliday junction resolvase-like predicted endonuclease
MQTTELGSIGEQIAAEALVLDGYRIFERNWKTKYCEIDIVATKDNVIYFVEVKYRTTDRQGDGFAYITSKKLEHMYRAAEIWVAKQRWTGEYTILAASITGKNRAIEIIEIA